MVHHTIELIPKMLYLGEVWRKRRPIQNVNIVCCRSILGTQSNDMRPGIIPCFNKPFDK